MDIYSLLNIKQDVLDDFPLLANRVADYQTERVYNQYTRTLKQIEDRMPVDKGVTVSQQSIEEIIGKVIRLSNKNDFSSDNWSIRELRIVSYYLMKLRGNDKAYEYALALLDKNWRNLYLNGLVFYLLNSWNAVEYKYRELTSKLLIEKLKAYNDNNRRYLCLKDHANLFEDAGPFRLAALLIQRGLEPKEAPRILGYKESAINQSYYSDVIIRYVKNKDVHDLDKIENIFEYHNLDRTRKLVLAHLVEREDRNPDGLRRTQLCRFVNRILGDVTMASTWAPFIGATDEEAQKLKRAMTLVNNWFTQQIIETFFEICVQDANRKRFWLSYVNVISGFKIVGSAIVKSLLLSDSRIGSLFIRHFIETNSHTSQTSALILFIKDKMIVEFSDTGALYVYNYNHSQVKMVLQRRGWITSTNDLKIPSMEAIIQPNGWGGYTFEEEGRMTHQGDWEARLRLWLQRMLLHKELAYSPFNVNRKEEDIFKAKPIPQENLKIADSYNERSTSLKENTKEQPKTHTSISGSLATGTGNKQFQFEKETVLTDVPIKLVSKPLTNITRIIASNDGFYLYHTVKSKFILLRKLPLSCIVGGSIWITKTKTEGWRELILHKSNELFSIGFIKEAKADKGFLFKTEMNKAAKRRLSFD